MMRIGLIGCGKWGQNYINTIATMSEIELVAVCRQRSKERPAFLPINCDLIHDWQRFHRDIKVDGVIVATNSHSFGFAHDLLYYGVPVMAEKPCLLDSSEIESLGLMTGKKGKLLVNYIHLFSPAFQMLKKIVAGKKIIRICSSGFGPSKTREYFSPLWDWGPHCLSMILSLINQDPTDVYISNHNKTKSGQTYRINLSFPGIKTTSIVGNGTIIKSRYLSVLYEDNGQINEIVYDDLSSNKLKLNGTPVHFIDNKPLLHIAIEEFLAMINSSQIDSSYINLTMKITKILSQYEDISV